MKEILQSIIEKYLSFFPEEKERQDAFIQYLKEHTDKEIIDWNNFDGHVVAGAFVYAKKEKKFLCLYHKDLKMYLYPGGHIDSNDNTILETARRETFEETGLYDLAQFTLFGDPFLPIDIDTHLISYNERLKIPKHLHFEFRYLFLIDSITDIYVETEELENYKWIDIKELEKDKNFGKISIKLKKFLKEEM